MSNDHEGSEGGEVLMRRGVRQHLANTLVEATPRHGVYKVTPTQHPQEPMDQRSGGHFRNLKLK